MKGVRRTRRSRQQAGFADLVAPPHSATGIRGVVTGLSHAQSSVSASNPTTPNPTTPTNPTTPPPLDEDWGALLQATPKRKMSPQKPIIATSPNSSSSTHLSPVTAHRNFSPKPVKPPSPAPSTPVPAFLSGWDGADGWGDDPSLDDSDQDVQEDAWGAWPDSNDILSSQLPITTKTTSAPQDGHVNSETFDEPSMSQPIPKQQSDSNIYPGTDTVTNESCKQPTTVSKTSPAELVAQNDHIHNNESPMKPMHTKTMKAETDTHLEIPEDEGGFENREAAAETPRQLATNDLLSEGNPVQAVPNSPLEQTIEDFERQEGVGSSDKQDSPVEIDVSLDWNKAKLLQEESAQCPASYTESIQRVQETTMVPTEETKPHFEAQEDQGLLRDNAQEQVDVCMPPETMGGKVAPEAVVATHTDVRRDPIASATLAIVPTDKSHDAAVANLSIDAWGLEEPYEEVAPGETGWAWGETDTTQTPHINDKEGTKVSSRMNVAVTANDITPDASRGESKDDISACDRGISRQLIEEDASPEPKNDQESSQKNIEVHSYLSLQPSTVPEGGWGFDEEAEETITDDWGWGASIQQDEIEFMVDSSVGKANALPSAPDHDSSIQGPACDSLHSSQQGNETPRASDVPGEDGDKSEKGGIVDKTISQKSHGGKLADAVTSFEAVRNSESDNVSTMGAQQSSGATHEGYDSCRVVGDSTLNQHPSGDTVLDHAVLTKTQSEQPSREGSTNSEVVLRAVEEDVWGSDVRSTDVDVTSTIAGTDVPSVAAASSVDDGEWDSDWNELRLNVTTALDMPQKFEMVKPAASDVTSSLLWSDRDHAARSDRSWTDPEAMWSLPAGDSQSPVAAEGGAASACVVGHDERIETEATGSKPCLPEESNASNASANGVDEKSSLQTARDKALSESVLSHPVIELEKSDLSPEESTGRNAVMQSISCDHAEIQPAGVHDILETTEVGSVSMEPEAMRSEPRTGIQSPQPKSLVVSDVVGSSFSPTDQSSNAYWNERLDQSRSKTQGSSNERLGTTSVGFLTKTQPETQMETQLASPDELRMARDNTLERGIVSMPKSTNLWTTPSELIEHPSGSRAGVSRITSSPSGDVESHALPKPAPQVGPEWECPLDPNQNGAMNVPSSVVDTKAGSRGSCRSTEMIETRVENGPTTNAYSQSFEVPEQLQWPANRFAANDGDGSNYFEMQEEEYSVKHDSNTQSDPSQRQESVSEETKTVLPQDGENSLSEWTQYAPRLASSSSNIPSSETVSRVPPPPPTQLPGENQQDLCRTETTSYDTASYDPFSMSNDPSYKPVSGVPPHPPARPSSENQQNVSTIETLSYDTAAYDPFSMSHEDSALEQAKSSSEAFDWNIGVEEPVRDAEVSLPPLSIGLQTGSSQLPRTSPTSSPVQAITVQKNMKVNSAIEESNKESSAVITLQSSQPSREAEIPGGFEQDFADREVKGSNGEESIMSANVQAPRLEGGVEDRTVGRHQSPESFHEDNVLLASGSQPFVDNTVGLDRYAPRSMQPAERRSGVPTEDWSSLAGRETRDNLSTNEDDNRYPHIAAPTGMALSDNRFRGEHSVPYQPPSPPSSSPYDVDAFKVPPSPPTQTFTSDIHGDMQSHQMEKGAFSSVHGTASAPESMHSNHLSMPEPLLPERPNLEVTSETPNSSVSSTARPEEKDLNERLTGYEGDHAVHRTTALSYVPVEDESKYSPYEVDTETVKLNQHSLPTYSMEQRPLNLSETRQRDSSSPYSPQAAYANVIGASQSQGRSGVPAPEDTLVQSRSSFSNIGEFNPAFTVPPPPQQVPLPPPSIPTDQEVFPAGSIIDPSTFSYPYSILDTETSGDLSCRRQRPLVSWGFGGKLVTVIPPLSTTYADDRMLAKVKGSSTVHIHDLRAISQDGSNDDWAAASEAVAPLPLSVQPPDLSMYAEMCDRLSRLSAGLSGSEAEARAAMWRVLALLCREGKSDWRINASTAICGPSSVPMFGRTNSSSMLSGKSNSESPLREGNLLSRTSDRERGEAAAKVERLLMLGNGVEAIRVAQEAGLWSIVLVLAATIDKHLYMKAVSEFAKSTLQDGSALQTLCLSTAENESEILRKATSSSGLKEWRKTVGMLLATSRASRNTGEDQQSRFLRLIDQIGEALLSQGNDILAGHVCFMVSGRLGPLDRSNLPLLGADPKLPAGRPRSMGSPAVALQSLVLEAVTNAQSGAMHPHILPFRLLLAEEICSVGRPDIALAHCDSITSVVKQVFQSGRKDLASKFFTLPFLSRLESLELRLRVHLGLQEGGERKGALSGLGKSLSSVFTRSSTADSRDTKTTSQEIEMHSAPFAGSQRSPQLESRPFTSSQLSQASPSVSPSSMVTGSQWTPKVGPTRLQPLPIEQSLGVDQSSQGAQSDVRRGDVSGNERWNSLVSKTIGFIAPAEGDLSPPLKARGDQGVPLHAQPTPLGLGSGTGSRVLSHDVHVGHMRSASVGDVPTMQNHGVTLQTPGRGTYSQRILQTPPQNRTGSSHDRDGRPAEIATGNGKSERKVSTAESGAAPTHRRTASDMTFESQTSEKKPPRPPKKSSALPPGMELQARKEKAPAIKGWRSRLSEKIRAAFSGPPRAHMGVENKFRYDKERGRWIMDGEDPNEEDDIAPPPPDDDAMIGDPQEFPFSQSYESLPNPDLGHQFMSHPKAANPHGADDLLGVGAEPDNFRRYPYNAQGGYDGSTENPNSRDTGSEGSVASAASAPVPFSSEPSIPMSTNSSNKFRAHPGRRSGRRAYVDTFNKGTPASSISGALPNSTRPGPPRMPGLNSSGGSEYRIFTPSPAAFSQGLSSKDANGREGEKPLETSSIVESSDGMHHETQTNKGQNPGDSFAYGLSKPAPMPSVEQYQTSMKNERQPRLMA